MSFTFVGKIVRAGLPHPESGNVYIKTMLFREMRSSLVCVVLQMPLSYVYSFVFMCTKSFGDGCFIICNKAVRLGCQKFIAGTFGAGCPADVAYIDSARVFTGENACPGGGTNRTGRIRIGKLGTLFGHPVKDGRLVKSTAIYANVRPAKIID